MPNIVCNIKLNNVPVCREREEQRQAKHASADNSKPKKEAASEAASRQPPQAAVAVLATHVEDSQLPGAAMQPPAADPVGKGLLTPQQISGRAAVTCCEQLSGQCCNVFLGRCCGYFLGRCCECFLGRCCEQCFGRCCGYFLGKCCKHFLGRQTTACMIFGRHHRLLSAVMPCCTAVR